MTTDDDFGLGDSFGDGLGNLISGLLGATEERAPRPETEGMASDIHKAKAMEAAARLNAAQTRWSTAIGGLEEERFRLGERVEVMRERHRSEHGIRRELAGQAIKAEMRRIAALSQRIEHAKEKATDEIRGLQTTFEGVRDNEQRYLHQTANAPDVSPRPEVHQTYQDPEAIEDAFSVPFAAIDEGVEAIQFNTEDVVIETEFSTRERRDMDQPKHFDPAMKELTTVCRGLALNRKKSIQRYHDTGSPDLKEFITDRERVFQGLKGSIIELQTIRKAKHDVGPSWVPVPLREFAANVIGQPKQPFPIPRGQPPEDLPQPTDDMDQYVDHINQLTDAAKALSAEYRESTMPPRVGSRLPEANDTYAEDRLPPMDDFQERYRRDLPPHGTTDLTASTVGDRGRLPPPWREGVLPEDVLRELDRKQVPRVLLNDLAIQGSGDLGKPAGRSPLSDLTEGD